MAMPKGCKSLGYDHVCLDCGALLPANKPRRKYCSTCRDPNGRKWKTPPKPKPTPLEDVAVAARAAGVSYGRFVAMSGK
jgi:hypothetical protein